MTLNETELQYNFSIHQTVCKNKLMYIKSQSEVHNFLYLTTGNFTDAI